MYTFEMYCLKIFNRYNKRVRAVKLKQFEMRIILYV